MPEVRLIDANALRKIIVKEYRKEFFGSVLWNILDDMPTIDAVPVVHGRWNTYTYSNRVDTYGNPDTCAECSECGFLWSYERAARNFFRYCPNCGAKMDGGTES